MSASMAAHAAEAKLVWTISDNGCVGFDEPKLSQPHCGIRDWAVAENGQRILTSSFAGLVQIWDDQGKLVKLVEFPHGKYWLPVDVYIVGELGLAHLNKQLMVVIDLRTGNIRSSYTLKNGSFSFLPQGLALRESNSSGQTAYRLFSKTDGTLGPELKFDTLTSKPPVSLDGENPPYTLRWTDGSHRPIHINQRCTPVGLRYCLDDSQNGDVVRVFDMQTERWRTISMNLGVESIIESWVMPRHDGAFWAGCGTQRRKLPASLECAIIDLGKALIIHRFKGPLVSFHAATDENNRSEFRIVEGGLRDAQGIEINKAYRVSANGKVRVIADLFSGIDLLLDNGIFLVDPMKKNPSRIINAKGDTVSTLPISMQLSTKPFAAWSPPMANRRFWLVGIKTTPPPLCKQSGKQCETYGVAKIDLRPVSSKTSATAH